MTPKEFKHIAPKLYELQKLKNGFDIPKEYFETVNDYITSSLYLGVLDNQNLFEVPDNYFKLVEVSVLEKIKSQNTSIPQNYFNTIEDKVFKKIQLEKRSNPAKIFTLQRLSILAVAASIMLLFTLQFFNSNDLNQFANLKVLEIENWIENGDVEIDFYDIAAVYEDINIEDIDIYNFYENDEILDYFNNTNVEALVLND